MTAGEEKLDSSDLTKSSDVWTPTRVRVSAGSELLLLASHSPADTRGVNLKSGPASGGPFKPEKGRMLREVPIRGE